MKRVLIIHGPNLNMLGKREKNFYGSSTIEEINNDLIKLGKSLDLEVEIFQSNYEGEIIKKIQDATGIFYGMIINPAAYTHTSIAIRDALLLLNIPVIEVHLSNIYKREPFRHVSMISDVVTGKISGLGKTGYLLALRALKDL